MRNSTILSKFYFFLHLFTYSFVCTTPDSTPNPGLHAAGIEPVCAIHIPSTTIPWPVSHIF